jgi:hypothetical protein
MNEQFPIVKSLGTLYDALYMASRRRYLSFLAKSIFSTKNYFVF